MPYPLIECVANFSEGRRHAVVDAIVAAIAAVPGVHVLGAESDADHNRAVISFAGAPAAVSNGASAGIQMAAQRIDMRSHSGQHPRIGAADVLPFIPLRGASMADCVRLARALGQRVGAELELPVFLYAEAALQAGNRELAEIRRGGYERLRQTMVTGQPPQPDFGPRQMGSAGACVIGARDTLIAFNVYLSTNEIRIARQIAKSIRASSGGLPHVKALGLSVKGRAQVSMNLTAYRITSIARVVAAIEHEAVLHGVGIESGEIIGLLPQDALSEAQARDMRIYNFTPERVLELRMKALGLA